MTLSDTVSLWWERQSTHSIDRSALSCGSKIGANLQCDLYSYRQWQTAITEWFTVSDIARFSRIAAYYIPSVKTHQWHENLTVYWEGQTLRRPPFPNIGWTCPPIPPESPPMLRFPGFWTPHMENPGVKVLSLNKYCQIYRSRCAWHTLIDESIR